MIARWLRRFFEDPQMLLLMGLLVFFILVFTFLGRYLVPVFAAVVIAFLLDGPVRWFERRGLSHFLSVAIVFSIFFFGVVIGLIAVIPPLTAQIIAFFDNSPALLTGVRDGLLGLHARFPGLISEDQVSSWVARLTDEAANLGPRLLEYSLSGLTGAVGLIIYAILVPLMVFFFLKDKHVIFKWIAGFLPKNRDLAEQVWREALERAADYARGKVYEIVIFTVAAFIAYQIIGLRYATLLAVLGGLSVLIPYVGAALATLPVVLVAYFQWGLSGDMGLAVGVYFLLQALDGNILSPLLFSGVVRLHPNAIIVAVLVFGGLWGFWGVFFAIPLATLVKAVIRALQQKLQGDKFSETGLGRYLE